MGYCVLPLAWEVVVETEYDDGREDGRTGGGRGCRGREGGG